VDAKTGGGSRGKRGDPEGRGVETPGVVGGQIHEEGIGVTGAVNRTGVGQFQGPILPGSGHAGSGGGGTGAEAHMAGVPGPERPWKKLGEGAGNGECSDYNRRESRTSGPRASGCRFGLGGLLGGLSEPRAGAAGWTGNPGRILLLGLGVTRGPRRDRVREALPPGKAGSGLELRHGVTHEGRADQVPTVGIGCHGLFGMSESRLSAKARRSEGLPWRRIWGPNTAGTGLGGAGWARVNAGSGVIADPTRGPSWAGRV